MNLTSKRVFVTGADGFIGSHLVEALIDEGCQVTALAYYNSFNSWGWLDSFAPEKLKQIEVVTGDIRDPNGIRQHIKNADIVFHLAALIAIPFSYHSPDCYVDTNIKGTLNILQASRDFNVEKVLVTSTSEVYGTADYVPIDEQHPRKGQSPYSATKIGADAITDSFWRSFQLPVVTVRPFNTYGPRQSARAVIPTIITQLLTGFDEINLGAIAPTRDLVFVEDTARGFIEIAKADKVLGEEINIATQQEISIGDLAYIIINLINPKASIKTDSQRLRPENSEVERLLGSSEKIRKLTNWQPRYTLEEGLSQTIEWFRDEYNLKQYKANIYNV
ncbi:MAG: NAD-dependent 4,6-dehydratase LegB [Planctomycetes bacterium]|nr:NAD-dependent 4,6-dehydratase LegB [Planctomycetota bacterium]